MLVHIPQVLNADQVARCRTIMDQADWTDGRVTAGFQSAQVKKNLQLPEDAPEAQQRELVEAACREAYADEFIARLPEVWPPLSLWRLLRGPLRSAEEPAD